MFVQRLFLIVVFAALGSVAVGQALFPHEEPPIVRAPTATRSTPLLTQWGKEINPDKVHSEYPRPTLVRVAWLNLNGYWDWKDGTERQGGFNRRILVPFPVESALSGITQPTERCVYRRTFTIPQDWNEEDLILLHFGAVDWEATVFVNGQQVGTHRGGYAPFSFDITSFIRRNEANELVVSVFDPTQKGEQPRGKQSTAPLGTWYTASTGIWQTVWLEPVPPQHIKSLQIYADDTTGNVTVLPILHAPDKSLSIVAEVFDGTESIAKYYGGSDGPLLIPLDKFKIKSWSPNSPHRYFLRVQLLYRDNVVDEVESYFVFRKVETIKDKNGYPMVHLNGKRLFLMGVTDQGYWPDGLYTAPADEAQLMDIRVAKSLGFNVIRKFQKIEPERWYSWCDRLGILVWQDMPSGENGSPASQQQFQTELQQMILSRLHHPSIMTWTIFNEGKGQHHVPEYVDLVRRLDSSRLINGTSGWRDTGLGDFNVSHKFSGLEMPPVDKSRAAIIGLFGGLTLVPEPEDLWTEDTWAHQHVSDSESLVERYEQMHTDLRHLIRTQGLAGAFFHQLTDVEAECSGFTPYNRRILKVPAETLERINQETIQIGSE